MRDQTTGIFLPEPSAFEAVAERVRRLLAEAKLWCDQERGRRAKLARIIGVSPQAISGWFREAERKHPRKQPTGEQVLALAEFLTKAKDR